MATLYGMKDIRSHYPFSEATVLADIIERGFPAWKKGGIWVSDTDMIKEWVVKKIAGAKFDELANSRPGKKRGR